jgi:hypothetical protein
LGWLIVASNAYALVLSKITKISDAVLDHPPLERGWRGLIAASVRSEHRQGYSVGTRRLVSMRRRGAMDNRGTVAEGPGIVANAITRIDIVRAEAVECDYLTC